MPDLDAIRAALDAVLEPELERSLADLDLVRGVAVDGGRVHAVVALTTPENPTAPELAQRIPALRWTHGSSAGCGEAFAVASRPTYASGDSFACGLPSMNAIGSERR